MIWGSTWLSQAWSGIAFTSPSCSTQVFLVPTNHSSYVFLNITKYQVCPWWLMWGRTCGHVPGFSWLSGHDLASDLRHIQTEANSHTCDPPSPSLPPSFCLLSLPPPSVLHLKESCVPQVCQIKGSPLALASLSHIFPVTGLHSLLVSLSGPLLCTNTSYLLLFLSLFPFKSSPNNLLESYNFFFFLITKITLQRKLERT
jgi:hypothetical protein